MTIKTKINSGLAGGGRSDSLDAIAARINERPVPIMAVLELVPEERVVPLDAAAEKDATLKYGFGPVEVALTPEIEGVLRDVHRAMFITRTANGTLTTEDEVKLSEQTLTLAADLMASHEAARVRVVLDWLLNTVDKVLGNDKLRPADVKLEIGRAVAKATAARDAGVQLDLAGAGR